MSNELTKDTPQGCEAQCFMTMLPSGSVRVVARIHRYGLTVEVTGPTEELAVSLALAQLAADVCDWGRQ